MKKLITSIVALLFIVIVPHLWAQQPPADVGTMGCRLVQIEVQEEMGDWDPNVYPEHGDWVAEACSMANEYYDVGDITVDCANCICYQFSRTTRISQQQSCGVQFTPATETKTFYRVGDGWMVIRKSFRTGNIISVTDETGGDVESGFVEKLTLEYQLSTGETVRATPIHIPDDTFIETHSSPGCTWYFYRGRYYRRCN